MRKTASVGSPLYYSPEIVMGVEYDEKIDIWDIGMMTYECLLGKIPFRIYSELDLNRIVIFLLIFRLKTKLSSPSTLIQLMKLKTLFWESWRKSQNKEWKSEKCWDTLSLRNTLNPSFQCKSWKTSNKFFLDR